ncbi:MAG: bifunctional serine/threonine-protein kinase/formylglycine-generating enzyme family protein [Acidobacteriota bacterium]
MLPPEGGTTNFFQFHPLEAQTGSKMITPDTILQSRYRVVKPLGEGGMGAVYLARDERLGSSVALKETLCDDESLRRAFEHEARLLANLRHAALPKVIDHFIEGQGQFLVMEFIPGEDLMQMLARRGSAFSVDEVLEWADQLLGALEYLHSRQPPVIHRDIKPANIKLTDEGQIVLLDFGLAKGPAWLKSRLMTGRSVAAFTPLYAPPEQMNQAGTDPRSDLFSLGATIYHLVTGAGPMDAMTRAHAITEERPDPLRPASELNPHVPPLVADALKQAMSLNRDRRFASATAMRKSLRDARQASDEPKIIAAPQLRDEPKIIVVPPTAAPPSPTFEFETVTLDKKGDITNRRKGRVKYFIEDLGTGVTLEMVEIPGGVFMMGSPEKEAERSNSEGPQHQVSVPSFYMGKFQVTQAQWRAMASLPKVRRDLNPSPSRFKGSVRPVEQVSWEDAVEFCARLSNKTGKTYRLPTEAEWEYACRAGTATPFAFGETITPEVVNYDGKYPYQSAPKGTYRKETIEVGSLGIANGFGLYDMHGNVWEWCLDNWHGNYEGAPNDGGVWKGGDANLRVLRGGSWYNDGWNCRSANRLNLNPGDYNDVVGFRVVSVVRTR